MMGNYQVRFLGGKGAAMPPTYPIETMKVTHILLPVAGFVMGGLYVLLYAFIDYCDTAPLDESFYDIISQILSHNDVRLAIYLWGFIGFTLGCIANLLVGFLQKHIKWTK